MKINFQVDGLKEAQAAIRGFSDRRMAAAMATALTRTAVEVKSGVQARLPSVFDRPTPYTINAMRYVGATAPRLYAEVGFDIQAIQDERGNVSRYEKSGPGSTPASKYLQFQTEGGSRRDKRFEKALRTVGVLPMGWYAVPGERAKMDAYGNQSIGEIRQILSWFDAAELGAVSQQNMAGSRQNMGQKGRNKRIKGTKRTAGFEYFIVPPGGTRTFSRAGGGSGTHKMQPGIYRRTNFALGSRIEPVIIFVRSTHYRKLFDFDAIAAGIANDRLQPNLERAIAESVGRLAARSA